MKSKKNRNLKIRQNLPESRINKADKDKIYNKNSHPN